MREWKDSYCVGATQLRVSARNTTRSCIAACAGPYTFKDDSGPSEDMCSECPYCISATQLRASAKSPPGRTSSHAPCTVQKRQVPLTPDARHVNESIPAARHCFPTAHIRQEVHKHVGARGSEMLLVECRQETSHSCLRRQLRICMQGICAGADVAVCPRLAYCGVTATPGTAPCLQGQAPYVICHPDRVPIHDSNHLGLQQRGQLAQAGARFIGRCRLLTHEALQRLQRLPRRRLLCRNQPVRRFES